MVEDVYFSNNQLAFQKNLIDLIDNLSTGVISVSAEWGVGKTVFAKSLKDLLEERCNRTLYFDAWEHDFADNPLHPLALKINSELGERVKGKKKALSATLSLLSKVIMRSDDIDVMMKSIEEELEEGTNLSKEDIKDYVDSLLETSHPLTNSYRKEEVIRTSFKAGFSKVVKNGEKVVIIIDELDRCRPEFSLRFLEDIKHLLNIEHCVFVIFSNEVLLESMYCHKYGSSDLSRYRYLDKFFDYRFSLPHPNRNEFVSLFFSKYDFDLPAYPFDKEEVIEQCLYVLDTFLLETSLPSRSIIKSLSKAEKVAALLEASIKAKHSNYSLDPYVLLLIVYNCLLHNADKESSNSDLFEGFMPTEGSDISLFYLLKDSAQLDLPSSVVLASQERSVDVIDLGAELGRVLHYNPRQYGNDSSLGALLYSYIWGIYQMKKSSKTTLEIEIRKAITLTHELDEFISK